MSPKGAFTCGGGGVNPPGPGPGWAGACPSAAKETDSKRAAGGSRRQEWTDKARPQEEDGFGSARSHRFPNAPIPLQVRPFRRVQNYYHNFGSGGTNPST